MTRRQILGTFREDSSGIGEYQPGERAKDDRLPIFDTGRLWVVALPRDSDTKKDNALEGRQWIRHTMHLPEHHGLPTFVYEEL